jgi:hypothetical protein
LAHAAFAEAFDERVVARRVGVDACRSELLAQRFDAFEWPQRFSSSSLSAHSINHCVSRRSSASPPQAAAKYASRSFAGKSSSSCASACARR